MVRLRNATSAERLPSGAPSLGPSDGRGQRIFISYRRRATADAALAQFLHAELERAGHEVFIDVEMNIGLDWSAEITRRIDWCEFLIILLSEEAIESEMVQEEVRLAHHRRKRDGTPAILPVRLRYEGELGYALGAYIGRLQYVRWAGPDDQEPVLARLLRAIGSGELRRLPGDPEKALSPSQPMTAADAIRTRPPTVADPRVLRQRPDRPALNDPCYLEREADRVVLPLAESMGETIVIKAPFKMGKTSLLVRYLDRCRQSGKRIAFLDFQIFSEAEFDDLNLVLTKLAAQLVRELGLDPELRRPVASPSDLTEFVEDVIFARLPEPMTIALDEVDRLVAYPLPRQSIRHAAGLAQSARVAFSTRLGPARPRSRRRVRAQHADPGRRAVAFQRRRSRPPRTLFPAAARPAQRRLRQPSA
jgi:hypothetical protein